MAVDLRSEIFQMRQAGLTQRAIAQQLQISPAKVQRELRKRAPEVRAERAEQGEAGGNGSLEVFDLPAAPGGDPFLAEERRQLELEALQLRRSELRSKRLEADRRAQLLEHPDAQGGNGLVALVLQTMERMREDQRNLLGQMAQRQAVPPPPQASLTEQLANFRQMADTVSSFAPPKAPSSAVDLEFKVAMERLNGENQERAARLEADMVERRERMASEMRRNDAVAKAIEEFAPAAATALQSWFERQKEQERPAPALQLPPANDQPAPRPVLVTGNEVEGECPNCHQPVAIVGSQQEPCPRCHTTLAVVEGRIRVRLPNGQLWPPPETSG